MSNLFGVDIMPDAVEICKLRLFLSLVAQVDADANKRNYGLEPLPDIDFNIRAGNTLVGFAIETEVSLAFQVRLRGRAPRLSIPALCLCSLKSSSVLLAKKTALFYSTCRIRKANEVNQNAEEINNHR